MRVATSKMSWRLWEIRMTARPCSARRATSCSTCSVCETPRAAVGSSRITSLEFHITARATATDCRWPPESVATGWRIDLIVVTASVFRVSDVFASIGGSFSRWNQSFSSRPRYMFWTTSRLSQSARSWYTTSIPRSAAAFGLWIDTGLPSKKIWPESIGWMPATHLIRVDLPAPLSPTSAITSPARTSRSTSVRACTEPNALVTPRSSRRGVSLTTALSYHTAASLWKKNGGARWGASVDRQSSDELLAVLLVLAVADVAPLQEAGREENLVVRLRDRLRGDQVRRLRPATLGLDQTGGRGLLALEDLDRGTCGCGRQCGRPSRPSWSATRR